MRKLLMVTAAFGLAWSQTAVAEGVSPGAGAWRIVQAGPVPDEEAGADWTPWLPSSAAGDLDPEARADQRAVGEAAREIWEAQERRREARDGNGPRRVPLDRAGERRERAPGEIERRRQDALEEAERAREEAEREYERALEDAERRREEALEEAERRREDALEEAERRQEAAERRQERAREEAERRREETTRESERRREEMGRGEGRGFGREGAGRRGPPDFDRGRRAPPEGMEPGRRSPPGFDRDRDGPFEETERRDEAGDQRRGLEDWPFEVAPPER